MTSPRDRSPFGLALLIAASLLPYPAAAGEDTVTFPVVLTSLDDLAELGIGFDPYPYDEPDRTAKPRFKTTCYDYGLESVGPSFLSLSDEFVERHLKRGFTRESLCMGLVSGARFDPETGRRLPTVLYKDEAAVQRSLDELDIATINVAFYVPAIFKTRARLEAAIKAVKRGDFDGLSDEQILSLSGEGIYEEIPLELPGCFRNGTPYLDCTWRYGLHKGVKFKSSKIARYKEFGRRLDEKFAQEISGQKKHENESRADPYLTQDGLFGEDQSLGMSYDEAPVTFFDVSRSFPRGYGYALYATGEKDNAVSTASILAAFDGVKPVKPSILKKILGWRS